MYQTQDGKERVIAYASRSLKPSEKNYPAHKLEFLALKWALCEKFHDYLYGSLFEVISDNNPLTYVLPTAKLDATGQRWIASLSDYNFSIKYRSGKKNADADGLSRCKAIQEERVIFPETLKAISHSLSVRLALMDRNFNKSFFHQFSMMKYSRPFTMTLDIKEEIEQHLCSNKGSFGLEWTNSSEKK